MATAHASPPPKLPIGVDDDGRPPLPWLAASLQKAQALDRAHALLLCGPAGAGHLELGLLLAQRWLCEADAAEARPCGRCASCHLVRTRVHPDLLIVVPDALRVALGWADADGVSAKADAKPSRDIRVEQVRQAIAWSQQTSGRGRGKFLLLHPADALNGSAANALLKTLEEPPGHLHLVLTSTDPEALLPTVRSRCQRVRLVPPAPEQALDWLTRQGVEGAAALLRATGGEPLAARSLLAEGLTPALWSQLPGQVAKGDTRSLAALALPRAVRVLQQICHDAMALAAGGSPRFFEPGLFPPRARLELLADWASELARVARHDEHPWNAPLRVEALVAQGQRAWNAP